MGHRTAYEADILNWSREQARLLRAGQFDQLDLAHLADEIEDVGKSEQRELASRMAALLAHLLEWQYQPERQGASWQSTIREQRRALDRRLQKTPSLQSCINDPDWWEDAWLDARTEATKETGIGFDAFTLACPWTAVQVFDSHWLPSSPPG